MPWQVPSTLKEETQIRNRLSVPQRHACTEENHNETTTQLARPTVSLSLTRRITRFQDRHGSTETATGSELSREPAHTTTSWPLGTRRREHIRQLSTCAHHVAPRAWRNRPLPYADSEQKVDQPVFQRSKRLARQGLPAQSLVKLASELASEQSSGLASDASR